MSHQLPLPLGRARKARSPSPDKCRICGCTDEEACVEGCFWISKNLCSQCGLDTAKLPPREREQLGRGRSGR
jgi:hypothetical protein